MAIITGKDTLELDNSALTRAPYDVDLGKSAPSGPRFATGQDIMRSIKVGRDTPLSEFGITDITKPEEFVISVGTGAKTFVQDFIGAPLENLAGQTLLEITTALGGREYPLAKYAKRMIADATNTKETRDAITAFLHQEQGIDDSAISNNVGVIIGEMLPLMTGAGLVGATGKAAGLSREAIKKLVERTIMVGTGVQSAGQYAHETAAQYLERTGDRTFSNFEGEDGRALSAIAYGAIAGRIETLGGVEPLIAGAFTKAGVRKGLIKQGAKIAAGEATEEFLQGMTEQLFRKADETATKTWGEAFMESLQGAAYGAFIGGTMGTSIFHLNRVNLTKQLRKAFPSMTQEDAKSVAETMIDSTMEASTQDQKLRNNLRQKVAAIYEDSEVDANTIDALTDFEYALIVGDANERGVAVESHPLFAGEVNELGWFRGGIPEARRAEIEGYAKEIRDLRAELKTLNEAKEKDWAKIEEVEAKLEAAIDLIPERVSGLVVADRAQMAQMLTEQRDIVARKNALRKVQQRARVAAAREAEKEERISERERQRQERKEAHQAEVDRQMAVKNLTRKIKEDADLKLQKAKAEIPLATKESLQAVMLKAGFDKAQVAQMGIRTLRSQVRRLKDADLSLLKRDPELVKQKKVAKLPNIMENQGEIDAIEELGYQTLRDAGYSNRQIAKMSQKELLNILQKELIGQKAQVLNQEAFDIAEENARLDAENPEYTGDTIIIGGEPVLSQNIQTRIKELDDKTDTNRLGNKRERDKQKAFNDWLKNELRENYIREWQNDSDSFYESYGQTQQEILDDGLTQDEWASQQAEYEFDNITDEGLADYYREYESGTDKFLSRYDVIQECLNIIDDWAAENGLNTSRTSSHISESEYIELWRENEDGDIIGEPVKIRLSDHFNKRTSQHDIDLRFDETLKQNFETILNSDAIKSLFGKERTVYNSNGDRIAKSEAALKNFWNWFGDSKVVDNQGRPLVVYHGTDAKFDTFDISKFGQTDSGEFGKGFYFTGSKTYAEEYGSVIMPTYLKITNPYTTQVGSNISEEKTERIKSDGYDGIVVLSRPDEYKISDFDSRQEYEEAVAEFADSDTYILETVWKGDDVDEKTYIHNKIEFVAFESNQIKSTENRGTFSPDTGNIYQQKGQGGQGARGAYIPEYRFIAKTRKMDESTLAHELAHDWIDQYFRYAQSGKASKEYMKRWAALSKALGIQEGDIRVSSEASEKFARAYEGWLLKQDWDKALGVADDEKRRLIEEFKRYQQSLRDIYSGLTDKYFKQTWGKAGELDPRIQAWFEKFGDIDVEELEASREPMTPAQESQKAVDKAIDIVIDNSTDPDTKKRLTAAKLLNDTSRYEVKGGNKNSLQRRLSALAKDIDQDGVFANENYNTHRDMMAVAEAADNFVKNRQQEAIDIINGVKPETDGLYASDLYTALERVAIETGDLDLLNELKGSKVANSLAKELGQRVAGFRNYKQVGVDFVQTVKALDRKYAEAAGKEKGKAQIAEATALLKEAQAEQDARDTKTLDSLLDMLKCK